MDVLIMKFRRFVLFFIALFFLVSPGSNVYLQTHQNKVKSFEAKVDEYIKAYLDGGNFSGSILIAREGKILICKGYGMANYELNVPNTPETRFHLASISKSFTATAIMILQERGLLNVNDKLIKFISDYDRDSKFPHSIEEIIDMYRESTLS
ncbi:hypothetical protein DRQ09_00795 [candidate division KSB1 bacterium]|nr:MAG: hypothetical protein DRQ09_00795 [candidate division KSB1 bacterium]